MVVQRTRVTGVDAARGVAVLGMIAAHVLPGTDAAGNPTLSHEIVSGRSAATFAVLAGVGVALAGRRTQDGRRRTLALRALLIFLLGLAVGALDVPVLTILAYYGLFFVIVLPFLNWPVPRLLVASAVTAVAAPLASHLIRPVLPAFAIRSPDLADLADPGALLGYLSFSGTYPAAPWLAYLLLGLAVGALPLDRVRTAVALTVIGMGLALAAHAASALLLGPLGGYDAIGRTLTLEDGRTVRSVVDAGRFAPTPTDSPWWLATAAAHSSTSFDLVATAGAALAVLGVALLLTRVVGTALTPLVAVGSMPLSAYTAHLVFLHLTWKPLELRGWSSYAIQVVALLLLAPLWRFAVGRGPLEAGLAAAGRTVGRAREPARP